MTPIYIKMLTAIVFSSSIKFLIYLKFQVLSFTSCLEKNFLCSMMTSLCDRNKEMSRAEQLEVVLERRQKLKEAMRAKMREENAASFGVGCRNFVKDLPYDNFGSFFGPSEPAISKRVLHECMSLLKTQPNSVTEVDVVKDIDSKSKAKKLKQNRDYSFLSSPDSELPAVKKESLAENTKPVSNNSKPVSKAWEPRKPDVPSAESRKQFGSKTGNQTRQHMGQKGLVSKVRDPIKKARVPSSVQKQHLEQKREIRKPKKSKLKSKTAVGMKKAPVSSLHSSEHELVGIPLGIPLGVKKEPVSSLHSSGQKQYAEPKRESQEPEKAELNSTVTVASFKPQSKPSKKVQPRVPMRQKKRPVRPDSGEDDMDDVRALIRGMFKYDPTKYAGLDEDVSNMETNYHDLSKEENRSAKLAREEDKEQLRLIEEEERREKMKKEAKRCKLSKSDE